MPTNTPKAIIKATTGLTDETQLVSELSKYLPEALKPLERDEPSYSFDGTYLRVDVSSYVHIEQAALETAIHYLELAKDDLEVSRRKKVIDDILRSVNGKTWKLTGN